VLGLAEEVEHLPNVRSSNDPTRLVFRGRLTGDPTAWGETVNPHVAVDFRVEGTAEPTEGTVHAAFTLSNADGLAAPRVELWGPSGPNLGTIGFQTGSVTRADGSVSEEIVPD
jgi:hypothetical protein